MTEQVKFPGTDIEAPIKIYARRSPSDGERMWFADTDSYEWAVIPHSLKYHRADTVPPNDQVMEMMLEAFEKGAQCHANSGYTAFDEQMERITGEIRSRYASSDSD